MRIDLYPMGTNHHGGTPSCPSSLRCSKAALSDPKACATSATSFRLRRKKSSFGGSRPYPSNPSSSDNSRESAGSHRSDTDTTTNCISCRRQNPSRSGYRTSLPASKTFGGSDTRIRQVLCTEYDVGVGIGWHRDKPHFDRIFGLSLGSDCKFRFRKSSGEKWDRFRLDAERRSLYMMSGASRQSMGTQHSRRRETAILDHFPHDGR